MKVKNTSHQESMHKMKAMVVLFQPDHLGTYKVQQVRDVITAMVYKCTTGQANSAIVRPASLDSINTCEQIMYVHVHVHIQGLPVMLKVLLLMFIDPLTNHMVVTTGGHLVTIPSWPHPTVVHHKELWIRQLEESQHIHPVSCGAYLHCILKEKNNYVCDKSIPLCMSS